MYLNNTFFVFQQGSFIHSNALADLAWTAQLNIWLMLADLYLKLGQPSQALSSIEEAAQISGAHPEVLYLVSFTFTYYLRFIFLIII